MTSDMSTERTPTETSQTNETSGGRWRNRLVVIAAVITLLATLAALVANHWPPRQATAPAALATPTATQINSDATATALSALTSPLLPPAAPLTWTTASMPPGNPMSGMRDNGASLTVAPSDGNTAYTCTAPSPPLPSPSKVPASVWVTHDRARHWTRAAPIPPVAHPFGWCWVVVDQMNPATAVLAVSWGREAEGPSLKTTVSFVTFNSGQSWQPLTSPQTSPQNFFVFEFATYHGVTIAIIGVNIDGGLSKWWVSRNHMRTWQTINYQLPVQQIGQFWINPGTGELLAHGLLDNSDSTVQLLDSHDLGLHWTTITVPVNFGWGSPLISPPVANQPWRLCGWAPPSASTTNPEDESGTLMCSMDGGHTWVQRPRLTLLFAPPYDKATLDIAQEFAVAPDGTVFAEYSNCYRLVPDTNEWQSIGPLPDTTGTNLATVVIPGAGIIWAGNVPSGITGLFPDPGA